jgi:hypothetical protein
MTLNPTLPDELQIFTKTLHFDKSDKNGRIIMRSDPRLQSGINARWQGIVTAYPNLIVTDDVIGKLVRELFKEIQSTNGILRVNFYWILRCSVQLTIYGVKELLFLIKFADRLQFTPRDGLIEEYWCSFFYSIAFRVSSKMSETIGLPPTAVKGACIGSIGNLHVFYKTYKNTKSDRRLLSDLKSYAYNKIKNSSYPDLRVQFSDDTIGRGNPGMVTHYKSSIADALRWVGNDESTNEILSESTIERKVSLCKWTIEYLREENKKKEPGAKKLHINELKLPDFNKICNLYCDNTSEFEYLRKINEGIKNTKERLMIKNLNQIQRDELEKLRCQLYDDLPQSIEDELDNIGAIIRRFIRRNKSISIDTPIGADNEGLNLGDIIASEDDSPEEVIENRETSERSQNIISLCNIWLRSKDENTKLMIRKRHSEDKDKDVILTLRKKQMLYLTYHKFDVVRNQAAPDLKSDVVYEQIAPIFNMYYTSVSRPVREICAKMADYVTKTINLQDCTNYHNSTKEIIKETNKMLKVEFDRLDLSKDVDPEARSNLDMLIREYNQYLKELHEEYHKFKNTLLKGIKPREYQKQLNCLEKLSQKEYPDLNQRLTGASFKDLIERINIPLSQLWKN